MMKTKPLDRLTEVKDEEDLSTSGNISEKPKVYLCNYVRKN